MKYLFLSLFLILFYGFTSISQGYLMLSGGSSEIAGGWSDEPYRWVVEHAQNKRVAVITYESSPSQWIPDYFKSFGAVWAKNFIIASRTTADMQSIYDSLITYNAVFIKGGDQSLYYNYYKGTKTQSALQYIYDQGGVLSGTSAGTAILSPIIYTAQIASVDPATALKNAYSNQITLANDFVNTLILPKKYIYDTHVVQRGRFGRIPAFMASWYRKTRLNSIGIGVDDRTALCIDKDQIARVYGTGAVNFFFNDNPQNPYDTTSSILRSKSLKLSQLLNGCSMNLKNQEINGLFENIQPTVTQENSRMNLFFSGTDYPSDDAFNYFINLAGIKNDPIVIVTGNDLSLANDAKTKLSDKGATDISIIQATTINQNDAETQDKINHARKFVITGNVYSTFFNFINGGRNGSLLLSKFKQEEMISFFVGDNARFAGKTVVDKYEGFGYTSYNGALEFLPGLELLKTTAIMPNAFVNTETYENTVSGIPYAMVVDTLKYGLFLTGNTFAEYNFNTQNLSFIKNISGSYPVIMLENQGTQAGLANQGPNANSRNIAGFKSMNLKYLAINDTAILGNNVPTSLIFPEKLNLRIYPNPVYDMLYVEANPAQYALRICDIKGRIIDKIRFTGETRINLASYTSGIYIINIMELKSGNSYSTKLVLNRK